MSPDLDRSLDVVRTPRMIGSRLRVEDTDELCELLLDPAVMRTLWPFPTPQTRDDVLRGVVAMAEHWHRYGFGIWILHDAKTGALVGRGGLQWTYTAGLDAVEVAWAIMPDRWRQGLGTELAETALDTAFGPLALPEVIAFTLPDNVASRRVMERTGFRYVGDIVHAGLPHVLYRHERDDRPPRGARNLG